MSTPLPLQFDAGEAVQGALDVLVGDGDGYQAGVADGQATLAGLTLVPTVSILQALLFLRVPPSPPPLSSQAVEISAASRAATVRARMWALWCLGT
ncbi:hypothetical protein [Streptomyces fulvoviolaceus]|uniref:hypothetical protein n=1 Tax=Streptomyces fulvoviolaceus TaxID=285535 RepID=UPI0004C7A2A5|nr:hypothetical protein [Streptomyces fulvoviolaceus]